MRWSENETYQFVKLYLKHELLWNSNHIEYKLKDKRLKALREIIAQFNERTGIILNEAEIRIKIRNLKSTYVQEKAKIKHRASINWDYKPNMKWFAEWHKCFVRAEEASFDHISDNPQQDNQQEDASQKVWLSQSDDNAEDETIDPFPGDEEYIILKSEPEELIHNRESKYKNKQKKIKHRNQSTDYSDTFRGSMDSEIPLGPVKEDEFDIYGKYIATQLRKMNLQKALRIQLEIQGLVSEARIAELADKD